MKRFLEWGRCWIVAACTCVACFSGASIAVAADADAVGGPPPDSASAASRLSTNVTEVIRLAESGSDEKLILAYVESTPTLFELSAEGIIYLKDLGIDGSIITAMLHHDTTLREHSLRPGDAPVVTT